MKAFVSCSLRLEDKQFVDFVESILKENGIEPFGTVGRYSASPENPTELMKENIHLADIAVIVVTKRYEQRDVLTGNVTFGPSEMIHVEVAMSFMADKPVVVIVQLGTDVGSFIPNITQYIILDGTLEDLNSKRKIIDSLLRNASQIAKSQNESKFMEIAMNGKIDFDLDAKGAGIHKLRLKLIISIESNLKTGPILKPQITLYQEKYRIKVSNDKKAIFLGDPLKLHYSADYEKINYHSEIVEKFTVTFGGDNANLFYSQYQARIFSTMELIYGPGNSVHNGPEYHLEIVNLVENMPVTSNNFLEGK